MMKHIVMLALIFASGCVANRFANPGACDDNSDCDGGECTGGFCLYAADAGPGTDAGFDGGCTPCSTADAAMPPTMGLCRTGCEVPGPGGTICAGEILPSAEACNEEDDDCDGSIDEDFALDAQTMCGSCTTECTPSETCCPTLAGGHECANLVSSLTHCGACRTPCAGDQFCCGSDGCVSYLTDENHCGECDNRCAPGLECCGGSCVDPRSSNAHCGGCVGEGGAACADTPASMCCVEEGGSVGACRAMAACATCAMSCAANERCCADACVDVVENNANCGGCGIACLPGQRCCGSSCVPIDDACGGCPPATGENCSAAEHCCPAAGGGALQCIAETSPTNCGGCGATCDPGETCCGAVGCVDFETNASHCGSCGNACGNGRFCSDGHCCDTGETWCGTDATGSCVTLSSDDQHCGSCDHGCGTTSDMCRCSAVTGGRACRTLLTILPCGDDA